MHDVASHERHHPVSRAQVDNKNTLGRIIDEETLAEVQEDREEHRYQTD